MSLNLATLRTRFQRIFFPILFLGAAIVFAFIDACAPARSPSLSPVGIISEPIPDPSPTLQPTTTPPASEPETTPSPVPAAPPAPTEPHTLRAATWNIRWFPSGYPNPNKPETERANIEKAAALIRSIEPEILCAQEIRSAAIATQLVHSIRIPDFQVAACSAFTNYDGSVGLQQTAVFSSLPVLKSRCDEWHTVGYIDPPRGYTFALLKAPSGPIGVFSIHLKSNYIPEGTEKPDKVAYINRLKRQFASDQVRSLASEWVESGYVPASTRFIVAGDFNTAQEKRWRGETTLSSFRSNGWHSCYEGLQRSDCFTVAAEPAFGYDAVTFDYIFTLGFSNPHATQIHPVDGNLSDHSIVTILLQ